MNVYTRRLVVFGVDITIWLFGKIGYLVYFLFGWRFICFTGKVIGNVKYFFDNEKREIIKTEFAELFGDRFSKKTLDNIATRSFELYYKRQVETFFWGALNKVHINKILHVEGLTNLDMALSEGRGVILLLSHFGSFLLPLLYLGFNSYQVTQITGNPIPSSLIAERMWVWRKKEADKLPVRYCQTGKFLKPVFEALQNNEIVAIAFDGRDGSQWVEVDFFEKRALFSPGPFEIARRTGAAIIPAFIIRQRDDTHKIILGSIFPLSQDSDVKKAVAQDVKKFARIFADYLVKYPCHFGKIIYNYRRQKIEGTANPFYVET